MRRTLLLCFSLMLWGGTMFADTEQTVTVDGVPVSGTVTALTFSGDNVTLTFDGSSTQNVDMASVNIAFTYDASSIEGITADDKVADNRVFNVSGQYVGNKAQKLQKGVYIVNGKKIVKN